MLFVATSILAGAALVTLSLWLRSRARQCVHWPSVVGQVTESRVDDRHLEMTKPVLRYRYEVVGKTYIGFRASFSGYAVGRKSMEQVVQPYPQGSAVRVYYDPDNPATSVLDNAVASDWLYWLAFGLGFWLLAAYLALH